VISLPFGQFLVGAWKRPDHWRVQVLAVNQQAMDWRNHPEVSELIGKGIYDHPVLSAHAEESADLWVAARLALQIPPEALLKGDFPAPRDYIGGYCIEQPPEGVEQVDGMAVVTQVRQQAKALVGRQAGEVAIDWHHGFLVIKFPFSTDLNAKVKAALPHATFSRMVRGWLVEMVQADRVDVFLNGLISG
jgi:hypothetical protein